MDELKRNNYGCALIASKTIFLSTPNPSYIAIEYHKQLKFNHHDPNPKL